MEKDWPVQDAKARFSELLRAAETEPQTITHRGEEKAVLISAAEYKRLKKRKGRSFYDSWKSAPKLAEFELPPRNRDRMRDPGF